MINNKDMEEGAQYFCVITGAIGVGKTTVYNLLTNVLKQSHNNVINIREYIDGPHNLVSSYLLGLYLNGQITDACFQNFIQSHYIEQLTPEKLKGNIVLMERCMSDSVGIFCNIANLKEKLSEFDFAIMYKNCIHEDLKVNAPNYFRKNFEFSLIKTNVSPEITVSEITKIIENDLKSGVKSRVIGLTNDPSVCYNRMVERARNCENIYQKSDIEINCYAYSQLYDMIQNPNFEQIRLVDLGRLLK